MIRWEIPWAHFVNKCRSDTAPHDCCSLAVVAVAAAAVAATAHANAQVAIAAADSVRSAADRSATHWSRHCATANANQHCLD